MCLVQSGHCMNRSSSHHSCVCTYSLLQCEWGSSVAPGQNFKYITCAKNVDMKNTLRVNNMLSKARIMHMCTPGVNKEEIDGWTEIKEGELQKEAVFTDCISTSSRDLSTRPLMATIKPIWLSDNSLHLISWHQTPLVIPDSWEAVQEKVQFNRFTARQNWVVCGRLTKSFLSQSLHISGFTSMSTDESGTRPLPVTPVSTTTWQYTMRKHYLWFYWLLSSKIYIFLKSNKKKKKKKSSKPWFTSTLELWMCSPLLDFGVTAEGNVFL